MYVKEALSTFSSEIWCYPKIKIQFNSIHVYCPFLHIYTKRKK